MARELIPMEEYRAWLDNLPQNLQSSKLADKLQNDCRARQSGPWIAVARDETAAVLLDIAHGQPARVVKRLFRRVWMIGSIRGAIPISPWVGRVASVYTPNWTHLAGFPGHNPGH